MPIDEFFRQKALLWQGIKLGSPRCMPITIPSRRNTICTQTFHIGTNFSEPTPPKLQPWPYLYEITFRCRCFQALLDACNDNFRRFFPDSATGSTCTLPEMLKFNSAHQEHSIEVHYIHVRQPSPELANLPNIVAITNFCHVLLGPKNADFSISRHFTVLDSFLPSSRHVMWPRMRYGTLANPCYFLWGAKMSKITK